MLLLVFEGGVVMWWMPRCSKYYPFPPYFFAEYTTSYVVDLQCKTKKTTSFQSHPGLRPQTVFVKHICIEIKSYVRNIGTEPTNWKGLRFNELFTGS